MQVRIIEYEVTDPERPGYGEPHRIITTLIDPDVYPAMTLIALYHERWEIEIVVDEIDTHQRLAGRPLRSQKPVGVIQEMYGVLLAHFVVRFIMHQAAITYDVDPDRLSFINSLRLVTASFIEFQIFHPDAHPWLWQRLLDDIMQFMLPERDDRSNPRVVKRKMSKFKVKRPAHRSGSRFDTPFKRSLRLGECALGSCA